jgi:hypothetical protein
MRPYLQKRQRKKCAGSVAQEVEHKSASTKPRVKAHYHQERKNKLKSAADPKYNSTFKN